MKCQGEFGVLEIGTIYATTDIVKEEGVTIGKSGTENAAMDSWSLAEGQEVE